MKKYIKNILLLAPAFLMLSSCWELDQEVLDGVTQEEVDANKDNETLIAVLKASAYSRIVGSWGAHNSIWSAYEVSSDAMAITQKGADWEDGGQWIRMHRHKWNPSEDSFYNSWNYCYTAIGEINNLMVGFPALEEMNAELRTLRAMIYLWLLDSFGNVPIFDETTTNPAPPNNSRQEVFDFIESSIKESLDILPKTTDKYIMNYWTAHALLAKLYLNAEIYTGTPRWADAEAAADVVINSGFYSLTTNFFANFATNNGGSTENILTLPYDENNATGFNLPMMALHYQNQFTYDLQEQPWNGYASLEEFYNAFDEDDLRKGSFLEGPQYASDGSRLMDPSAEANDPDGEPLTFTPEINELAPNALRQAGTRIAKFEYAIGAGQSLSNDYPLIRLSDMYLIKAEAAFRQGKTGEALTPFNMVRERAGLDPLDALTLDDIYNERGFEFFAEASRRTDQIRFGKFLQPWWEKEQSESFRTLFPIPLRSMNANTNLVQNPGY